MHGLQSDGDVASINQEEAAHLEGPPERTLAEILAEEANPPALVSLPDPPTEPVSATTRAVMSPPAASVVQPDTTSPGLIVASAALLGLILMVTMCSRMGGAGVSAPEFKDADAQSWRAVMLDDKQPASVRLSNAQAIVEHFPNSTDAGLAGTMTAQLEQAAGVESVEAATATAARASERQALVDRKERRDPITPGGSSSSSSHTGELVGCGRRGGRARKPGNHQTCEIVTAGRCAITVCACWRKEKPDCSASDRRDLSLLRLIQLHRPARWPVLHHHRWKQAPQVTPQLGGARSPDRWILSVLWIQQLCWAAWRAVLLYVGRKQALSANLHVASSCA